MEFYPGQKVVCVNAGWHPKQYACGPNPLRCGAVYTIKSLQRSTGNTIKPYGLSGMAVIGSMALELIECDNPYAPGNNAWCATRFRPLDEQTEEIEAREAVPA